MKAINLVGFLFAAALSVQLVAPASPPTIKCYQCESSQGDCGNTTPLCEGLWCVANITENKSIRARFVNKGCASTNPAATKEDGCIKDTTQPDGTETYRCGCSSESCNSEAGIARLQSMLSNQFALPGGVGTGGQPSGGVVPPGLVNPNSTFTDVLSGQPNPFPGNNPLQPLQPGQPQPQPGQIQPGQIQPNPNPGAPPQPNASNPVGGQQPQFPPSPGSQPFPQGAPNVPPSTPNQNKPIGGRPGGRGEPESGFGSPPGAIQPGTNDIRAGAANGNDSNRIPSDNRPATTDLSGNGIQEGRSRSGAVNVKNGARTCACTEPSCSGPCKGEACYMMIFSANDVHSQAFAGKQGQIVQSGCTDDPTVLPEGVHSAHRQIPNYRFKINGQDITVPASATYCNDGDYCNGAGMLYAKSLAIIAGVSLAFAFLIRF